MRNFYISIVLGLIISINQLVAQNIEGQVVDASSLTGIESSSVKILSADSLITSTITKKDGKFAVKIARITSFNIHVTCVGYLDTHLQIGNTDSRNLDLGVITLYPDTINLLNEVEITASNVIDKSNKMIVIPTEQQIKFSSTSINLLEKMMLPGLFVDPVMKKLEIEGTSKVIYRINGINASLEQIYTLVPNQIQRIEYMQTPSMRELNSDAGVINFILKKKNVGTYANTNILGSFTTGFLNGNVGVKTVFSNSELSFDYSVSWRNYSKRWSIEKEKYLATDDSLTLIKKGQKAPFGYLSQDINIGYTYNTGDYVFSAKFLNTFYNSHDRNYLDIYKSTPSALPFFRNIYSKSKNYFPSVDLYLIKKNKEGTEGVELNLVGTILDSNYKRSLIDTYTDTNLDEYSVYNRTEGDKKSIIFEGFYYNNKNKKASYSLGLQGDYSYVENKYLEMNDNDIIKQTNIYPYFSFDSKIKNVSISFGSGVKFLHNNNRESKSYFRFLTTLNLYYQKSQKWNVRNLLKYTPSYPSSSILNNVEQKQDSMIIVRGNPNVKPASTLMDQLFVTLNNSKNIRTSLSAHYLKRFNPIRNYYYYEATRDIYISETENQKYEQQFGGTASLKISSIFNYFSINMGTSWTRYYSKGIGYYYNFNNFTWFARLQAEIKDFSINLGYQKPSKTAQGQFIYLNENNSSISASYSKNNFLLTMGVMFPFTSGTKYGIERKSDIIPSSKYIYIKDNANMVYLNLTYTISSGKSLFNVRKRLNNGNYDNGIMKIQDN